LAEKLYEGMFLLDSGQFASDPDGMTETIQGLLEKAGGTVIAQRPWQDGRLAYEIEGRRKGLHFLTYFRMQPDALAGLNRACRLNDKVLRHLFITQHPSLFEASVAALTGEDLTEEGEADGQDETSADDKSDGDDKG